MLKVNVGLSRKLSKDYNSTGFTINLEGEVAAPPNDAAAVVEQVKELYDLAEEALSLQIERSQGDAALASHDEAFSDSDNQVSVTAFWVSELALVMRTRSGQGVLEGFVLEGMTGEPLPGALVRAWIRCG